jgi:hypothetical protein
LGKCENECQSKFTAQEIRNVIQPGGGPESSAAARTTLLYDDLKKGVVLKKDHVYEQHYILNNKRVCRNFYLRARGVHNQMVFYHEQEIKKDPFFSR